MSEDLKNTDVLVTSLGRARLRAALRLCTGCRSQPSLFPFDRVRCSVQLVLDSPVTRLTRPPSGVNVLVPSAGSRVESWTSCRYLCGYLFTEKRVPTSTRKWHRKNFKFRYDTRRAALVAILSDNRHLSVFLFSWVELSPGL